MDSKESNFNIEQKKLKENGKEMKEIARMHLQDCYDRAKNADVKAGILLAFQAVLIIYMINNLNLKEILDLEFINKNGIAKYNMFFIMDILLIICTIVSLMCILISLISKQGKALTSDLYDEKYLNETDFTKKIILMYKEIIDNNVNLLKKKSKALNIGVISTIISSVLIIIDGILKIIL